MASSTKNKKSGTINNPTGVYGSSKPKTTTTTLPVSAKIYTGYQSPQKSTSTTSKSSGSSTSPSPTSADKGKAMGTYRVPQPTKSTTINNPTAVYGSSKPKTPTLPAAAKIYKGYQSPNKSNSTTEKWTPSIADKLKVKRELDRIIAFANGVYIPPYKQQTSRTGGTINNPSAVYGAAKPKEEGSATASSISTYYSKPIQPTSEDKSKAMGTYRAPAFTEQNSYGSPYKKSETQQLPHQIAANELHKILAEQKSSGTIHNPSAVYGAAKPKDEENEFVGKINDYLSVGKPVGMKEDREQGIIYHSKGHGFQKNFGFYDIFDYWSRAILQFNIHAPKTEGKLSEQNGEQKKVQHRVWMGDYLNSPMETVYFTKTGKNFMGPGFYGGESSVLVDNKYLPSDEFEQSIQLYDKHGEQILEFDSAKMYQNPASDWVYACKATVLQPNKIVGVMKHEKRDYLEAIKNAENTEIGYNEVKQDEKGKWYLEWEYTPKKKWAW